MGEYIDTLEKYIDSGLLEVHLLKNLRIVYSKALDQKLEQSKNDKNIIIKKLRNCVELAEFNSAFEIGDYLILNWPTDERSWIESIRGCINSRDGNKLQEIVLNMRNQKINWTRDGKEQARVWLEVVGNETQL